MDWADWEMDMFPLSFMEYLVRQNLQHMIVYVTNRCNYRCNHCFVDFSEKKEDLDLDYYISLARQVGRLFWLDIGGGEPFLREDLPEIIAAFNTKIVMIPSNGSLRDLAVEQLQEIRRRTDAEIGVSLSIDGFRETHDRIRNRKGSWDKVWETYESIRKLDNISVKINTVLSRENYQEILDLMREVRKRGPDFHSVILLRGEPNDPAFGLPPLDELSSLIPEMLRILAAYHYGRNPLSAHILRNYHRYLWMLSSKILREHTQVIPCLAGRAHMVVMADGSVCSCELLPPVGSIKTQSWNEIMKSNTFKAQLKFIMDKKCYCTHNCALLCSILFNPASIPHLIYSSAHGVEHGG